VAEITGNAADSEEKPSACPSTDSRMRQIDPKGIIEEGGTIALTV
jgi:hypothetical protein